jgi:hypothetical protein
MAPPPSATNAGIPAPSSGTGALRQGELVAVGDEFAAPASTPSGRVGRRSFAASPSQNGA